MRRAGLLASSPPAFAHPLVRAAIVAEIPAVDRARLHRDAARVLVSAGAEPERPAAHLLEVDPAGEPWVVDTLTAAADATAARGAPETAARLLRRALAEPAAPERRCALLMFAGGAEAQAGDLRAIEHLREAADAAGDVEQRVSAIVALTSVLGVSGDVRDGIEVLQRELEAVERADLRLQLEAELDPDGRAGRRRRARSRSRRSIACPSGSAPTGSAASCPRTSPPRRSAAASRAPRRGSSPSARWPGDGCSTCRSTTRHAASALMLAGYFGAALAAWADYVAHATRRGDMLSVAWGHAFRAGVQWRAGALSDALADAELARRGRDGRPAAALRDRVRGRGAAAARRAGRGERGARAGAGRRPAGP